MNFKEYVDKNKEIQNKLLLFFDKEDEIEEHYSNLVELFTKYKIIDNSHELKSLLYLISNISNNHYQTPKFIFKIERILEFLKSTLKNNFTNQQIFSIFKNNKAILLILIEQKIITFDETILKEISSSKYFFPESYHQFFFPEIQRLIEKKKINSETKETNSNEEENESKDEDKEYNSSEYDDYEENDDFEEDDDFEENDDFEEDDDYEEDEDDTEIYPNFYQTRDFKNFYKKFCKKFSKKLPENFQKERQIGQNEKEICKLIRDDSIEEFITYVNKNDYPLNSYIQKSIFETNDFLNEQNKARLIEYAAFFGSTQIFKYLYKNGVELTSSLWLYAIHSDNPEIIQLLEENHVSPPNESYEKCIEESIKCHHNDITNYILSNYINSDIENINNINFEEKYEENIYSYSFHYYNFSYFPSEIDHKIIFYYACEYDYIDIVEYFMKTKKIDFKEKIIINQIIMWYFK